jgi:glycyl-tRNA synthetase
MGETTEHPLMERIVALCKRRGFIFQSSELYGGINGFWDYGPLGAELKRNLRDAWWQAIIREREDCVGLDAAIIMHPKVWKASGHVDTFSDPMVDCLASGKRFRADQVEPLSGDVYKFKGAWETALAFERLARAVAEMPEVAKLVPAVLWDGQTVGEVIRVCRGHADPALQALADELAQAVERGGFRAEPFRVLVPADHRAPEAYAGQIAKRFYQRRGLQRPWPELEGKEGRVEATRQFNSERGLYFGAELTPPRPFNLMFQTTVGPVADEENVAYLRPETAQAIFAQFKNVFDSSRVKIPFGIGQIGKAFRNEINPRNFTFRSREFEQMELEYFIRPDEAVRLIHGRVAPWQEGADLSTPQPDWGWELWHRYWVAQRMRFYHRIGLSADVLDLHWQSQEELAHYAKATVDILFKFPFGADELEGIAARGDFDLAQHQKHSGKPLEVFDDELRAAAAKLTDEQRRDFVAEVQQAWLAAGRSGEAAAAFCEKLFRGAYLPHVIEPSAGVDRLVLALICHAYSEDEVPDEKGKPEKRVVMRFHPRIAPIKVGVFPLLKNRPELVAKARAVRDLLRPHMAVFYDEAGAIGRRYRRQDEAGTPFGVTIDFDTLGEHGPELKDTVTLRDRDTCQQVRVKIDELLPLLQEKLRA